MEASGGRRGVGEMRILANAVPHGRAYGPERRYVSAWLEQMSRLPYDARWPDFG